MSDKELSKEEIQKINEMINLIEEERYYELLNVHPSADKEDIRKSYYGMTRSWHPDRFYRRSIDGHKDKIERIFMMITKAYRTLSDDQERKEYDRTHVINHKEVNDVEKATFRQKHRMGSRRRKRNRDEVRKPNASEPQTSRRRKRIFNEVKKNISAQQNRAKHFFEIGQKELAEDRPMQAAASLHVACKLEPNNSDYKKLYVEAKTKARAEKALEIFAAAENAEQYQNYQEALRQYRKAVEYEVDDARAYARLAYLVQKLDPDPRETLRLMQIAVKKDPENAEYRCILGEIYAKEGLNLNARREFTAALELQKNYKRAKEGLKNL